MKEIHLNRKLNNMIAQNAPTSNKVESKPQSMSRPLDKDEQIEILKHNEPEKRNENADLRHRYDLIQEENEKLKIDSENLNTKYASLAKDNNKQYSLLQLREKESKDISKEVQMLKQKHKDEIESLCERLKNAEKDSKSKITSEEKYRVLLQKENQCNDLVKKLECDIRRKDNIILSLAQSANDSHYHKESHVRDVIEIPSDEEESKIGIVKEVIEIRSDEEETKIGTECNIDIDI